MTGEPELSAEQLEQQYNNRARVPDHPAVMARWKAGSEAARAAQDAASKAAVVALIVGLIFWALTSRARPGLGAGRVALGAAVAGLIGGIVMVYFFGVLGFVGIAGMEFGAAVLSMAPFVPGDLIKLVVAVILIVGLWKAYPRAFR